MLEMAVDQALEAQKSKSSRICPSGNSDLSGIPDEEIQKQLEGLSGIERKKMRRKLKKKKRLQKKPQEEEGDENTEGSVDQDLTKSAENKSQDLNEEFTVCSSDDAKQVARAWTDTNCESALETPNWAKRSEVAPDHDFFYLANFSQEPEPTEQKQFEVFYYYYLLSLCFLFF